MSETKEAPKKSHKELVAEKYKAHQAKLAKEHASKEAARGKGIVSESSLGTKKPDAPKVPAPLVHTTVKGESVVLSGDSPEGKKALAEQNTQRAAIRAAAKKKAAHHGE